MSEPVDIDNLIANLEANYYDLSRCVVEFVQELESLGVIDPVILSSMIKKHDIPRELES